MAKRKLTYQCQACGSCVRKWQGQCPECGEWNTLEEVPELPAAPDHPDRQSVDHEALQAHTLAEISLNTVSRLDSGINEVNRVLGGGIVPGSVVLVGGDPGIGKSSLLIQMMTALSRQHGTLYISGEESMQQVALRARRMGLYEHGLQIKAETEVTRICALADKVKPEVMVIDSIQTMQLADIPSAAGGVTQVRETAAALTRYAKTHNCTIILVGHVTKSGEVAGPRVLEHIVDSVVFLEGQNDQRYRVMRTLKNRFGSINEIGIFAMTDKGMQEIRNPSAIFLSAREEQLSGSVISALWEGTRPLLVEVQALADENHYGTPRRVSIGVENNRLIMLLAVMHRHASIYSADKDIFINVSGGLKVNETSVDLALVLSVASTLKDVAIPGSWVVFGEVGLSGEVRPVSYGMERITEAQKHGFTRAVVPYANRPKKTPEHIEIIAVKHLDEILELLE